MPITATPVDTPTPLPPGGDPVALCEAPPVPQLSPDASCGVFVKPLDLSAENGCFFNCDEVFANIRVLPTIRQGTLVEWELHPNFRDAGPYEFQLQFGRTGDNDADDWAPVGASAFNVFMMIDDEQRVYGKTNWAHYRICLTTPLAQYFSRPVSSLGDLSFTDRRIFTTMLKAQMQMMRHMSGSGSRAGSLLKRRLFGTPCDCLDKLTREVTDAECPLCYGTSFAGGYYDPIDCIYAAMHPNMSHNNLDGGRARGTIDEGLVVAARMLAVPQLFEEDVWVDPKNDNRWYLHKIQNAVEWRGVAIAVDVELRLAPYTDPIYEVDVPNLLPSELVV